MKSEKMLDLLGGIDDGFVVEGAPDRKVVGGAAKWRRFAIIGGSLAAAFVAAFTVFAMSDVGARLLFPITT